VWATDGSAGTGASEGGELSRDGSVEFLDPAVVVAVDIAAIVVEARAVLVVDAIAGCGVCDVYLTASLDGGADVVESGGCISPSVPPRSMASDAWRLTAAFVPL
jgi:hypothetical protein